ncbi:hypothetical protein [Listeria grandensis]|uniref:Uncharacterized protein n=1 Tax=Listeria grandensis TaxID=1494963 RepID=A0A7X1CPQ9_9LIST|nr:hypothetical protein [Listeria grandensis]MBC1936236.1 hypothetical protein [Listeria grandensis]MBC6315206.1 hypothetical protein [Listeria grandensis]
MYFKYFYVSGIIGLILVFVVQVINFIKKVAIQGGLLDGDAYQGVFNTGLMAIPIIFFCISFVFLMLYVYKDLKIQ